MYFSFWEFSFKVQLCFGLAPKSDYISMLLALNCLIPASIMCTSLLCSSSRSDSGETELPCVWIKASFSYLAHLKWQMHSIILLLEIVQHFFPILICFLLSLNCMAELLLSPKFVISPLHFKEKKHTGVSTSPCHWVTPLHWKSWFILPFFSYLLISFINYCFKTSMVY